MSLGNDFELSYYQSQGATADDLQDAEREFLLLKVPGSVKANQGIWEEYLIAQGFSGAVNDMRYEFWAGIAGVFALLTPADFVATNTIDVYGGDFTIDWGDGVPVSYIGASPATVDVVATGGIIVREVGAINRIVFLTDTLTNIDIVNGSHLTSMLSMCANLTKLISFNAQRTGLVDNFKKGWEGCINLAQFPLINSKNVDNFNQAWMDCSALVNFPILNCANVTNFKKAWQNCTLLSTFPVLDTRAGDNFDSTWRSCSSFVSFPALNFDNALSLVSTFRNCDSLLAFPSVNFENVVSFRSSWRGCSALESIGSINTLSGLIFLNTFRDCINLMCLTDVNTLSQVDTIDMFLNTDSLLTISTLEINDILVGANYVNAAACP